MINLRTDGGRAVVVFRRERPKGVKRWFYYTLEKDLNGVFQPGSVTAWKWPAETDKGSRFRVSLCG